MSRLKSVFRSKRLHIIPEEIREDEDDFSNNVKDPKTQ